MAYVIISLVLLAIAVERLTELVVASDLFDWLIRQPIKKRAFPDSSPPSKRRSGWVYLDKLLSCGYCVSVWAATPFAFYAPDLWGGGFANWLISVLLLHGLANLYHVLYEIMRRGRVRSLDLSISWPGLESSISPKIDNR